MRIGREKGVSRLVLHVVHKRGAPETSIGRVVDTAYNVYQALRLEQCGARRRVPGMPRPTKRSADYSYVRRTMRNKSGNIADAEK